MDSERDEYDDPPPGPSAFWVWVGLVLVAAFAIGSLVWAIVTAQTTQENS